MIQKKSVRSGLCEGSSGYFCALEATKCNDSDSNDTFDFYSSFEISETAVAHGGNCYQYDTLVQYPLGKCVGGPCGPNAESCGDTNLFSEEDTQSCTVQNTRYGMCGNRCSWSPNDCQSSEFWSFPAEECSCEFVRVGACIKMIGDHTSVTCAVSPDGCDTSSEWVSAVDVPFQHSVECTLCRKPSTQSGETIKENLDIVEAETESNEVVMSSNVNESVDESNDQFFLSSLLGSLIGGILVALVISFLSLLAYRRSRTQKSTPPKSIQVGDSVQGSRGTFVGGDGLSDSDVVSNTSGL